MSDLIADAAGVARCRWCGEDPEYVRYHDEEWGRPVSCDRRLFEKICLEGFQSGLSWLTILRKRERFREAFDGFEIETVAEFGEAEVARLLGDAGIVRHRGKIEAAIGNARAARRMRQESGRALAAYLWSFEPAPSPPPVAMADVPATTPASEALAKALKKEGWRFVGPTTAYAFMQSMGMVDDHLEGCAFRAAVEADRAAFERPR